MSEPKRYRPDWTYTGTAFVPFCRQQDNGEYVRYEDYASLKAEAEQHRLASIRVDVSELHAQFKRALLDEAIAENARLKAEVERLTKAGDKMAHIHRFVGFPSYTFEWEAAKEGKQ
jgi:hypothetical protein